MSDIQTIMDREPPLSEADLASLIEHYRRSRHLFKTKTPKEPKAAKPAKDLGPVLDLLDLDMPVKK